MEELRRVRSGVLQGIFLRQETIQAAKERPGDVMCGWGQEIVGMVEHNRPTLCLQTTVRNKCTTKVVEAMTAALHAVCDQGEGFKKGCS